VRLFDKIRPDQLDRRELQLTNPPRLLHDSSLGRRTGAPDVPGGVLLLSL